MTDIYDIKDIILGFPINFTYSIIYILFICVLYFTYKYLTNKKDEKIEINNNLVEKEKIDFNKILKNFELKFINEDSEKFYSRLLEILRDILESFGNKNISKMTFEEIQELDLDNSLKNIIKSIYYKEYVKQIEDSKEIRTNFINKIKKLIK